MSRDDDVLRQLAEGQRLNAMPTTAYIGLSVVEAEELAASEARYVVDRTGAIWETMESAPGRVRVWLDAAGRVERAEAG